MHDEERRRLAYQVQKRKDRGDSGRQIARSLGIHRQTVKRLLQELADRREKGESALEREVGPAPVPRASKLDPFVERIDALLKEFEDITAERLHEELRSEGFTGGYTIVREYLKKLTGRNDPQRAYEVIETPAGQQAQFDWSPYDLPGCGAHIDMWGYTLSCSRGPHYEACENATQPNILSCLKGSFERYGGVPHECVTDTMAGVVDRWECGKPILNVKFVDFAAHYGFAVDVSPRGYPQYKGKKERTFRYVKDNLLNGRKFSSIEELREVLAWWITNRALQRPHPRTGLPIAQMVEEERPFLKPLPAHPYDTREVVIRLVDPRGLALLETNGYPVPDKYIGQVVYICADQERVEVLDRGVHRIAVHERLPDGARIIPIARNPHRRRYDLTLLLERLAEWGEIAQAFGKRLQQKQRYSAQELSYIINLQLRWSADDIVKALAHAMNYGAYEAASIERILEARFTPRTLQSQIADSARNRVRELMRHNRVQQRLLTDYKALKTGDTPSVTTGDTSLAAHQEHADQGSGQAPDSDPGPDRQSAPERSSNPGPEESA